MPLKIFLASKSPRRTELLSQIGIVHEVVHVDVDETVERGEAPDALVLRLAAAKANAGYQILGAPVQGCVLGADTVVVHGPTILGKPRSAQAARAMLASLSGRTHQVMTGAAIVWQGGTQTRLSVSKVQFRVLCTAEIDWYVASGEPMDKAGAYGIQGLGGIFVTALEGSYSGVMGLALHHVHELMRVAGVELWMSDLD
tara:strand:+ start:142 stop:738 length:597 start_codon:yes stop_codon:yes gene_type:complete